MAKEELVEFPWLEQNIAKEELKTKDKNTSMGPNFFDKFKIPLTLVGVILILLFINIDPKPKNSGAKKITTANILVPVMAFGKGEQINPVFLKSVEIHLSKLTKTQRLNLLVSDDLNRIDGKIYAKRSLAPYRPIFWNYLVYKDKKNIGNKSIKIIYGTEEQKL